ncbi:MAG TPA: histidine kinase [Saprospiraceae bacterium]|nr:histidine kinase [Saprospiraceae bacterium]
MLHEFDIKAFFLKNKKQVLISIFLFWFFFALLILVEDEIAFRMYGMKADHIDRLQYFIRWVLWTLLTPLIIYLAIKFPIQKERLVRGIAKHFLLAILFTALEFSLEIPLIRFATLKITGAMPTVSNYAVVFILKFNIYLLLYFLVIGATYLLLYVNSYNQSRILAGEAHIKNQLLQTQLAETKLSLLKMQLDPHFLFNTHHSIVSLMLNNENDKAIRMLTGLSDLLRHSLDDQQQTILLEKELHLLKLYLGIQETRFHERLKVNFQIDSHALSQKVPSFILQPLVENAIKHGISVSSKSNTIAIHASLANGNLILSVENDGASIDFSNFKEGIGISNTKERLSQLYNGRSTFVLKNHGDAGVLATITIPKN